MLAEPTGRLVSISVMTVKHAADSAPPSAQASGVCKNRSGLAIAIDPQPHPLPGEPLREFVREGFPCGSFERRVGKPPGIASGIDLDRHLHPLHAIMRDFHPLAVVPSHEIGVARPTRLDGRVVPRATPAVEASGTYRVRQCRRPTRRGHETAFPSDRCCRSPGRNGWRDRTDRTTDAPHLASEIAPGKKIVTRFLVLTKTKEPQIEEHVREVEPGDVKRTLAGVERVWRAIESGVFYPAPSTMNCSDCGYRVACRVWAG